MKKVIKSLFYKIPPKTHPNPNLNTYLNLGTRHHALRKPPDDEVKGRDASGEVSATVAPFSVDAVHDVDGLHIIRLQKIGADRKGGGFGRPIRTVAFNADNRLHDGYDDLRAAILGYESHVAVRAHARRAAHTAGALAFRARSEVGAG